MDKNQALIYVKAAALAVSLPLDDARASSVCDHLVVSAEFARQLEAFPLDVSDEPAGIYCPAPFPSSKGGSRES